jgi:hypothetical protein
MHLHRMECKGVLGSPTSVIERIREQDTISRVSGEERLMRSCRLSNSQPPMSIEVRILDHLRSIGKVWQEPMREEGQRMVPEAVWSACTQRLREGELRAAASWAITRLGFGLLFCSFEFSTPHAVYLVLDRPFLKWMRVYPTVVANSPSFEMEKNNNRNKKKHDSTNSIFSSRPKGSTADWC